MNTVFPEYQRQQIINMTDSESSSSSSPSHSQWYQPASHSQHQLDSLLGLSRASQMSLMNISRALESSPTSPIDITDLIVIPPRTRPSSTRPHNLNHKTPRSRQPHRSSPSPRLVVRWTDRSCFYVFVKVLLKYVSKTRNAKLQSRVKRIIAECVYDLRMGQGHAAADHVPLVDVMECRLRTALGEWHWARANICFEMYCAKQGVRCIKAMGVVQAV